MTAKQFKETIEKLGLSLEQAGVVLGMATSMMYKYANGVSKIPKKVQLALEALTTRKLKKQNLLA